MNNQTSTWFAGIFIWIVSISISVAAGILTWKWLNPVGFWNIILFLIIWGILSKIGHFIAGGSIALLGLIFSNKE